MADRSQKAAYLHPLEVEVVNVALVQVQVLAVAFLVGEIHQVCNTHTTQYCGDAGTIDRFGLAFQYQIKNKNGQKRKIKLKILYNMHKG